MITPTEDAGPLREHRLILLAAVTIAVIMAAYWPSFSRMLEMWSLANYQHGWLVYPISAYILWRRRQDLATAPVQGSLVGVVLTALVVLTWIVSRSIQVQAVEFGASTLLIFAAFWAVGGTHAMQQAAFPLLLLVAAIPAGEILIGPLMETTATIATSLLHIAGVPVYRDGMFLTLPGGSFEVAKVCSGLRFLLAGVMASLAYAYVTYSAFTKRVAFVGIAAIVLVIANGVRAFIIMLVASSTEMRLLTGEDHVIFGMVLFAVAFTAMIYLGSRYADSTTDDAGQPDTAPGSGRGSFSFPIASATLLLVLAGPAFEYVKAQEPVQKTIDARLPDLPNCQGPQEWNGDWSPEFTGADQVFSGSFACGDYRSSVYVASYLRQQQGKELINSTNRVWPRHWRRYVDETSVDLELGSGKVSVRQVLVRAPDRWVLMWYWYQTDRSVTGSAFKVKLQAAAHALSVRPKEASLAAIAISVNEGEDLLALRDEMEDVALVLMSWNRERLE
jgi:exosortase A